MNDAGIGLTWLARENDLMWLGRDDRERRLIGYVFDAHAMQVDKQGVPYHRHLRQTADMVHPDLKLIAYAHDILEDTDTDPNDLYMAGFTPYEVNTIITLTKRWNESRLDYLLRVRRDADAVRVKLADTVSNLSRLSGLDKRTQDRLQSKYYETLTFLAGVTTPQGR